MKASERSTTGPGDKWNIEPTLPRQYAGRMQSPTTREGDRRQRLNTAGNYSRNEGRSAIVLTGERMRDERMVSVIAHTLEWNRIIPGNIVNAMVCRGHVTLAGYVHSHHDREEAEMLVKRLPGVCDVENRIEVLADDILSSRLKSAIMNMLQRHTKGSGRDIGVVMNNGKVVLTGTVESMAEKRLVLDALEWAPYVHAIEDRLEVVPE